MESIENNQNEEHKFENEHYTMKNIKFNGKKATIILQNKNGPCPLLAIGNILLLSNNLSIRSSSGKIKTDQLLQVIGNLLMKTMEDNKSNTEYATKFEEAMSCLPLMQYGMHFNAIFGGVRLFEKTKEFSVFELLKIPMVHGWIVDQSNKEAFNFISPLSYDTLMEKICLGDFLKEKETFNTEGTSSLSPNELKEIELGKIGSKFLQESSSQLTFEGLIHLHQSLKEDELCVFFRNNHFGTLIKKNNSLYLLVTDDGYSNKQNIIWEKLEEVEGDNIFVDSDFIPINVNSSQDNDYSQYQDPQSDNHYQNNYQNDYNNHHNEYQSDHSFAKQMQEEEKEKYIRKKSKKDKKYRYERRMVDGKEYIVKIRREDYESDDEICKIL